MIEASNQEKYYKDVVLPLFQQKRFEEAYAIIVSQHEQAPKDPFWAFYFFSIRIKDSPETLDQAVDFLVDFLKDALAAANSPDRTQGKSPLTPYHEKIIMLVSPVLEKTGRINDAIELHSLWHKIDPRKSEILTRFHKLCRSAFNWPMLLISSIGLLKAESKPPFNPRLLMDIVNAALELGKDDVIQKFIDNGYFEGQEPSFYANAAQRCYPYHNKPEMALEFCEIGLAKYPRGSSIKSAGLLASLKLGKLDKAAAYLADCQLDRMNDSVMVGIGCLLAHNKRRIRTPALAPMIQEIMERALTISLERQRRQNKPQDTARIIMLLRSKGDYSGAIASAQRYLVHCGMGNSRIISGLLYDLNKCGRHSEVAVFCSRHGLTQTDDPFIQTERARAFYLAGDMVNSYRIAAKAAALYPERLSILLFFRAICYATNKDGEYIAAWEEAKKRQTLRPEVISDLAWDRQPKGLSIFDQVDQELEGHWAHTSISEIFESNIQPSGINRAAIRVAPTPAQQRMLSH